jgi:hypothetical protein
MDTIEDIRIGVETKDGVQINFKGAETITTETETIEKECYDSTHISREELRQLVQEATAVLERDELTVTEKTKITEIQRTEQKITQLYIEPYTFPESADLSEHWGVLTDSYELGTSTKDDTEIQQDITHSSKQVTGTAFRLNGSGSIDFRYTCRLTNWEYDDNGELTNIEVPTEPYDSGHFGLKPGDYRVWEETITV